MRWGALIVALLFVLPARAGEVTSSLDVAPTTLDLRPGVSELLYVTNHGPRPVMVQIEAMDWRQDDGRDRLTPSTELMTSPPMARIAPGARQSVRVMARPDTARGGDGERAYRLLVSELPDPADTGQGVHVLLQFSVPVFVRHDPKRMPQLQWSVAGGRLRAANTGDQTAKLAGLSVDGTPRPEHALFYLLPGASRDLGPVGNAARVRAREGRSGQWLTADIAP